MAKEKKKIQKIIFPYRKRIYFCGMCGLRCSSFWELENHVESCEKSSKRKDVFVYRADNHVTMQI